jgi:hypothetical protein
LSVTFDRVKVFSGHYGFLDGYSWPPQYNWTIVESGVKYHNPNLWIKAHLIDLRQFGGFLRILLVLHNKTDRHDITEILSKNKLLDRILKYRHHDQIWRLSLLMSFYGGWKLVCYYEMHIKFIKFPIDGINIMDK